ncbi:MAG: hypothetical protein R3Y24_13470 [Eubacteriales bacterium]
MLWEVPINRRYLHDAYKVRECEQAKKCLDFLAKLFTLESYADENNYITALRLDMRKEKYPADTRRVL